MKKKIYAALLIAMMTVTLLSGCQSAARNWGGTVKIELEPGQKLEMITWKGDSLWYLTRPMRAGESSLARGKWIEAPVSSKSRFAVLVFPRKREVD